MGDHEAPEDRCGFVLEPGDVPEHAQDTKLSPGLGVFGGQIRQYGAGSDLWYERTKAVCCRREVWDGADDGRCIWHAESDDKSPDALIEVRADEPERLDGASVPAVELGDAIDFDGCRLLAATFDGTGLLGASFEMVDGRFAQFPDAGPRAAQFRDAFLRAARFPDTDLQRAQFPDADLRAAQFPDADLRAAQFPDADLRAAQFPDADLRAAQFPDANLRHAQFPDANLRHAQFRQADLFRAKFPDADLSHADLTDADTGDAKFTRATLEHTTLTNADLAYADLTDARLHDAHMLEVRINDGTTFDGVIPEEADAEWFDGPIHAAGARLRWWLTLLRLDADERADRHDQLDKANTVYRTIQRLYRENSMPRRIDTYYVRARDTRRKQAIIDGDLPRWLYLAAQRWVMGYGERPWRVVATSGLVILGCAVAYPLVGGVTETSTGGGTPHYFAVPLPDVLPGWVGLPGVVETVLTSLYFSVVTFTTLGYGDLRPRTGAAQFLATFESLVGAFLLALLVYVLGRRATR